MLRSAVSRRASLLPAIIGAYSAALLAATPPSSQDPLKRNRIRELFQRAPNPQPEDRRCKRGTSPSAVRLSQSNSAAPEDSICLSAWRKTAFIGQVPWGVGFAEHTRQRVHYRYYG
jgi:hypothetical protein